MESSHYMDKARSILDGVKVKSLKVEERRELAIELAGLMLNEARRIQTNKERRIQAQLARMMDDFKGKVFTTSMTDQCFRSERPERVSSQIVYLMDKYGTPKYLKYEKQLQLKLFRWLNTSLRSMVVPLVKQQLRRETSAVILPGERDKLRLNIQKRHQQGLRVNLNHIGEAILGENEARNRLDLYLKDLQRSEIEYISVKISSIFSQINLLSWEDTVKHLQERLKLLYREASSHEFIRPDGLHVPKFVNLDMEEYRDLHLTVEAFKRTLEDPEFFRYSAGIVLQSYLPESHMIQQQLTTWAMQRVANGGGAIKIRIVKGANLAMEKVEASIHNWAQAPYDSKANVDANYKRMMNYACKPEHARAAHIGVGSHNLFDIAYVMLLREENGIQKEVCFEMLAGMADHMRRVVHALTYDMLVYCPAAKKEEFQNAVAYLIRRLDENTSPKNFLHHAFGLIPGTREWHKQANFFSLACHAANAVSTKPRRYQGRSKQPRIVDLESPFDNEPDTDWTLPDNRCWIETIAKEWQEKTITPIPAVISGKEILNNEEMVIGHDPSRPGQESYRYTVVSEKELDKALSTAKKAEKKWGQTGAKERASLLSAVGNTLRQRRGELIGVMIADAGKLIPEADAEVSEAIDFADYYSRSAVSLEKMEDVKWSAKGTIVVAPPWNFPCAIPAGGVAAALAAGNCVILKPAPETVLTAWYLAQAFWDAGISKEVLQFLPCKDDPIGSMLIKDERVNGVILTGSTETAKLLKQMRPNLDLMAETGGKNAIIVSDLADRDLAISHIVQSAFGHAGQKCSACSLLICLPEVYNDEHFRKNLTDAVASWKVGSAWDLSTRINPLITNPPEKLLKGLTTLEEGEEWLLEPTQNIENPNLWSPGIKLGVQEGSFTHQTEFFGPLLGIMLAKDFEDAIRLANATPYGLTAGLQTLDPREQEIWKKKIVAGNLYINRGITGAIVLRQPFGGCKASSFGRGIKAGGPSYLTQLMHAEQNEFPKDRLTVKPYVKVLTVFLSKQEIEQDHLELWNASLESYEHHWKTTFHIDQDAFKLLGQDNILQYISRDCITLRIQEGDRPIDYFRVIAAAITCNTHLEISSSDLSSIEGSDWVKLNRRIALMEETEEQFISRVELRAVPCIRFVSPPSDRCIAASAETMSSIIAEPVLANGRLELLHYLREVAISSDYHRYGNLGEREKEKRRLIPRPVKA